MSPLTHPHFTIQKRRVKYLWPLGIVITFLSFDYEVINNKVEEKNMFEYKITRNSLDDTVTYMSKASSLCHYIDSNQSMLLMLAL